MTKSLSFLNGQNIKTLNGADAVNVKIETLDDGNGVNNYKLSIELIMTDGFIENAEFKNRENDAEPGQVNAIWERGEIELGLNKQLSDKQITPTLYLSSNTADKIYFNVVLELSTDTERAFKPWQLGDRINGNPGVKRDWQFK